MVTKFMREMVSSQADSGKVSHTKFWSNVGMASMTIIFLWYGFHGTLPEWYMWVYAPTVAAPQLLSKLISLRWGVQSSSEYEQDGRENR